LGKAAAAGNRETVVRVPTLKEKPVTYRIVVTARARVDALEQFLYLAD
jgi:hypothetical protein